MTYRQFICSFNCKLKRKVIFLTGGSPEVQRDALSLVVKRIRREQEAKKVCYYLSDVKSEPFQVLNPSCGLIVFTWDSSKLSKAEVDNLWEKEIPHQLLEGFSFLPGQVVILNVAADSMFFELFKKVYPKKRYAGCFVDCSVVSSDIESFIKGRLNFVLGISLDSSALSLLCAFPYESLFNVFSIMEALQQKEFTGVDLKRLGLPALVLEERLAQGLILRGSSYISSVSLKGVNVRRFLLILCSLLCSILRLKTKERKYSDKAILSFYSKYREEIDNLNIEDLYRHLYLTLQAFRWAGHSGGLYVFLNYW